MDDTAADLENADDLSEEGQKLVENDNEAETGLTSTRPEPSTTGWGFRATEVRFPLHN